MNEEVRKRINTVRSSGVLFTRSEAKIRVVNYKEVMVMGLTNKLKLDIGGHKVKMVFTVIEGIEVDCILGMDYLDKTKVVIFNIPSERKLTFSGDLEVYLNRRKSKENAMETKGKNIVNGAIIERNEVNLVQEEKYDMEDDGNIIRTVW